MSYAAWRQAFVETLDARFYTIDWLDGKIESGAIRIWSSNCAAILATIRTFPTGAKDVHGMLAVGELQGVLGLIPLAEAWGREQGCVCATIESRHGWAKMLPDYEHHQSALRKEL